MKIKRLEIENFRNHTHSILEFDGFNFLRGGNFQGKSSIAQAISMCLTPSTMGLDTTGRGFATKIKRNATKAVITADIQGKAHTVRRSVTLNTNTTGRTDSSVCLDDPEWHPSPFDKLLDSNRPALSVILNTERFFTMDEKEQKNLLAKLALPSSYDFPEETIQAVDKAIGVGNVDFDGEPFAVIDKAYKLLYTERQMVNRQVKEFSIPDAIPETGVNVSRLKADLDLARVRQKKIAEERDQATKQDGEVNVKRTRLQGKIDSLTEKIAEDKQRLDRQIGVLSDAKLKELQKVAEGKAALDKLESERSLLSTKMIVKKNKVQSYAPMLGISGECPTCHQDIDAQSIAELHQKADNEWKSLQNRDNEVLQLMKTLGDVAGAVKTIENHMSALTERAAISVVITEKTKLLNDATAELNKLPTATETLIPFVKPLDEVDAEITSLIEKLQPAVAAEERKKEIETKKAQLKVLEAKAASVDALVKYFDKDGIKAELLAERIGGFEDKLNFVLGEWGYSCTLSIEPFEFLVTDATGTMTPVKELSGSEQLMFAAALQCAVARVSGIGLAVIDKMDTFLPEQRSKANRALYGMVKNNMLDQIFILASDVSKDVPQLDGSAFFLVEAGTVRRL